MTSINIPCQKENSLRLLDNGKCIYYILEVSKIPELIRYVIIIIVKITKHQHLLNHPIC